VVFTEEEKEEVEGGNGRGEEEEGARVSGASSMD
jgi:hypothetical protein